MYRPPPRFSAGLKALGAFWLLLLIGGGGVAAWLHMLGPPAERPVQQAEAAPPDPPPVIAAPAPPTMPAMPAIVAPAAVSPAQPAAPAAGAAPAPSSPALAVAEPDPDLLERLRDGALPRVAEDGRAAWRSYARPFDQGERRPRIGVLVAGLGISESATEAAIERLPGAISLAFSPYGLRLGEHAAAARAGGHEVLVGIPLEPVGFPLNDPGPYALLTSLPWGENSQRLTWVLSRFSGYVGVTNATSGTLRGERFSSSAEAMRPVLEVLRTRGLLFVEARPGEPAPDNLPGRTVDVVIDERPVRAEIDQRLAELERVARAKGAALGLSGASPLALEKLATWSAGIEGRGFVLAPVTALSVPPTAGAPPRRAQR